MSHFRSPGIGSWGWEKPGWWHCCHRVGPSIHLSRGNVTGSVSVHLPAPFHPPPPLQPHIIHHLQFFLFLQFILDVCTSEVFFFITRKKNVSTQDTKTPNCFCKTWIAWYSFFPASCFNLTKFFLKPRRRKRKKNINFVFNSIFKLRDVVLLPFYKVCSL